MAEQRHFAPGQLSARLREVLEQEEEFNKAVKRFFDSNDVDGNSELDCDEFRQVLCCLFFLCVCVCASFVFPLHSYPSSMQALIC